MPHLDIFRDDAFSVQSLTAAILKAPHKPGRIGELGLFRSRGITTTTATVEEKNGRLSLIATSLRGEPASTIGTERRTLRSFIAPHLERESKIYADEVQNVRAFGSESELQSVQPLVDERLADLRAMHEVTLEYHRMGAIKGIVLDSDGSTPIHNLFTEFNVSQHTVDINLSADVRNEAVYIQRLIEAELGAEPIIGFHAFCGDDFFDALVASSMVKDALKYQESVQMRRDLRRGFDFGGVTWENYRGNVGGVPFVAADEAYVLPIGPDIFQTYFAPADFLETVNTVGLPVYAKVAFDLEFNRWVKVHSQSNPLCLCLRPRAVVKVTGAS